VTTPKDDGQASSGPSDPDAIRAEIEETRQQLGRTVDELSDRLDVPARAKESAARAKDTAVETYRESPPAFAGAGAVLAGLVGLVLWRRRRAWRRASNEELVVDARVGRKRKAKRARKELAARRKATQKAVKDVRKKTERAEKKARRSRRRKR
jgi:LPXTG-motif cell wall-anchored protein